MDILYLAHRIPYPPTKGEKLRAFHAIRHLSARHRVWCACFVDRRADLHHVPALAAHCHRLEAIPRNRLAALFRGAAGLMRGMTVTESYFSHARMEETVKRWARETDFDAVIAFSSSMGQYIPMARAKRRIVDFCDLDSRKWMDYAANARGLPRVLYQAEGRRLERVERHWIEHADASVFITAAEAGPWLKSLWRDKLHVVGNGVEQAQSPGRDGVPPAGGGSGAPRVGFSGEMSYWPNVDAVCWFVRDCWPAIRAAHPDAVFEIVGRNPAAAVLQLARQPGVVVTGEVRDVGEYVRRWTIAVAPLRIARGLQNKVLEAMAHARPVVLTTAAATGINAVDGRDWLIADEPEHFIRGVGELIADPDRAARLGAAARAHVIEHHQWPVEMAKLELLLTRPPQSQTPPRETEFSAAPIA